MLWNNTYETGVAIIDEQHKELFRQIDILLDTSKADRIDHTLAFLASYVVKHFSTEEKMQQKVAYPKMAEHKRVHEDFIKTFKELNNEYQAAGNKSIIAMKLTRTALNWLKEHIRGMDKEFASFYMEKA